MSETMDTWDALRLQREHERDDEAIHHWARRRQIKFRQGWRFAQVAERFERLGTSTVMIVRARKAASDEQRHGRLCEELMWHFGATQLDALTPAEVLSHTAERAPRHPLLLEVLGLSGIGKSIGWALLSALVGRAPNGFARAVMHSMLADEARHSRLGWAFLAQERRRHRQASNVIREHLPLLLEEVVDVEFFADAACGPISLDRQSRAATIQRTLTHVVFPRLQRLGVDTTLGEAWLDASLASLSLESST